MLEAAGDEAYTKTLLAKLNGAADAFSAADAGVRGQWTALKTREQLDTDELDVLANKVRCLRSVVEFRISRDERVKFRQMLRIGSRGYVRHGNAEQPGTPAQIATTPAATAPSKATQTAA